MEIKEENFGFAGYSATVRIPERPNGKWIWKTEFFEAFDSAEREANALGFTRVYYKISDRYGSPGAVELMYAFQKHLIGRYAFLNAKCILFGFSRGGLYAFNYATAHPGNVEKVYLDAPVLDLKSWPPAGSSEHAQMLGEYGLDEKTFLNFRGSPVDGLEEYFSKKIPTLLVAGLKDETVDFEANSGKMIKFCSERGIPLEYYLKPDCGHHPHSLSDISPIIGFCFS